MAEYEQWKDDYEDIDPLEDVEGINKRGLERFRVGAPTRKAAEEAGRCAAEMDNGNYCIRLPVSSFVEDGSDFCYHHRNQERENDND